MLQDIRWEWKNIVEQELQAMAQEFSGSSDSVASVQLSIQTPPKPEMGDIAFPLFPFAKIFKTSPNDLAILLVQRLSCKTGIPRGSLVAAGPYLNIKADISSLANDVHNAVLTLGLRYGSNTSLADKRFMVEFSCPNTNKPLHLGHLRNDSIGSSISRILAANGAAVRKVNLINNRGIHICKSMLAYQKFGEGETPETSGMKGDHLVGKYYVRFAQWEKEDPSVIDQAREMLRAWELGDPEVLSLWERMNSWTLDGVSETYRNTGVDFDQYYYESETYTLGKDNVIAGLDQGVFYREEDGSIWIDLAEIGLDKKVLLRKDGTSLYLTQDIGTAIARNEDWPFDFLIYVVASEQAYHFKVLFHVLAKLGYSWASGLYHLSYGMVNLPDGKMKSREGTVVDADELFAQLSSLAIAEIKEKQREEEVGDIDATGKAVALGALNYYLLQVNPTKDMVFNPAESISFNGNTGPYLQYMGARISSMLRKLGDAGNELFALPFDGSLLELEDERELVKLVSRYPEVVFLAGRDLDPSVVTAFLYELSRTYSKYYHDVPVLKASTAELVRARVGLSMAVLQVLRNAYMLVGIPFLDAM